MAKDVLIRNIDEEILDKLKKIAEGNNRSLQQELKLLLERHAGPDVEEIRRMARESIETYKAQGRTFTDSTDEIRELRGR